MVGGGRRVALPQGRALGVLELGDPRGRPVVYCHGFPGSRLEPVLAGPAAAGAGVRLIAVDRPGYGLSEPDPHPDRSLADWPAEVVALAGALDLEHFAVLGVSGGGPYALACARFVPGRLTAVGVVCGLGPLATAVTRRGSPWLGRLVLGLARRAPGLVPPVFGPVAGLMRRHPERLLALLASHVPQRDRDVLERPQVRAALADSMREAVRQGGAGAALDAVLYTRPWGFSLEEIDFPVRLWHGVLDRTAPVAMGERMAAALPACEARFLPDEGHYSLPIARMAEILEVLVESGR
jgi:pimeloyl-ACP methyl ester carboxylesterase